MARLASSGRYSSPSSGSYGGGGYGGGGFRGGGGSGGGGRGSKGSALLRILTGLGAGILFGLLLRLISALVDWLPLFASTLARLAFCVAVLSAIIGLFAGAGWKRLLIFPLVGLIVVVPVFFLVGWLAGFLPLNSWFAFSIVCGCVGALMGLVVGLLD